MKELLTCIALVRAGRKCARQEGKKESGEIE